MSLTIFKKNISSRWSKFRVSLCPQHGPWMRSRLMKPSCHDPQGIANLIEQGSKRADKLHQPEVDRSHVCGMHCFFLFIFLMFREKNIKTLKATLPETNSKLANAVKRIDGWKLENQSFSFRLSALFSGAFWLIARPFPTAVS